MQVECDTTLESSQGSLKVCFTPHPNQNFKQRVMTSQSLGSPNWDNFGTPFWESKLGQFRDSFLGIQTGTISGLLFGSPGTKSHSDVGATERRREYYIGEGGGFPRVRVVVSLVNPKLSMTCLSTKGAPKSELTTCLLVWSRFKWIIKACHSS